MPLIKAIFWDNDGVLVETEHLYFEATRDVLASVGIPLSQEQYVELSLIQGKGAWHLAVVPTALTRSCAFAGAHRILESVRDIPKML